MLISMTGFGGKIVSTPIKKNQSISLSIEIKTLNSRFFEATCRLPSYLSYVETEILAILKSKLLRGRVFLNIQETEIGEALESIEPSLRVAKGYIKALQQIKKECSLSGEVELKDLVSLPNLFIVNKPAFSEASKKKLFETINTVIDEVIENRKEEGKLLADDIKNRLNTCEKNIKEIEVIQEQVMQNQKQKVADISMKAQSDDEEAKVQLEFLYESLNKLDVSEEIIRFGGHLATCKKLLNEKQVEKGKKFDFLAQELLREINTISSKCSDFKMTTLTVDVKVELEKIREQIQNIL